ncbi:MAG TPA: CDP-alcohol phosphatidyltransferase family protein [Polyangia bacterium]|nr:CDP-alcohol phosphatidyltransferase family protein [Polyangia bacterium]
MSGRLGDVVCLLGFIAFFTIPFLVHGVKVLTGAIKLPPARARGAGARLFGPLFISYYYWLLGPVFRAMARSRWTPNQVTILTLGVAAATSVAIATGHFTLASWLVIGGGTLDIIDGQLARTKNMATSAGAFLDSTVDRICDGLVFGGCVVYYAGTPIMYVALAVLVMSFTVSYARSRAEFFGITGSEGLMQRADRLAVLGMALAFASFFGHRSEGFVPHPFYAVTAGALCLLAFLNTITAVRRILWTMAQFRRRGLEVSAQIRPSAPANVVLIEPKSADALLGAKRETALRIGG